MMSTNESSSKLLVRNKYSIDDDDDDEDVDEDEIIERMSDCNLLTPALTKSNVTTQPATATTTAD